MDEIPTELSSLEKLEQILIAQWTLYEKIMVMPTWQLRKIKGATCNVPVERDQTCNQLPHPPDRSGIYNNAKAYLRESFNFEDMFILKQYDQS